MRFGLGILFLLWTVLVSTVWAEQPEELIYTDPAGEYTASYPAPMDVKVNKKNGSVFFIAPKKRFVWAVAKVDPGGMNLPHGNIQQLLREFPHMEKLFLSVVESKLGAKAGRAQQLDFHGIPALAYPLAGRGSKKEMEGVGLVFLHRQKIYLIISIGSRKYSKSRKAWQRWFLDRFQLL